MRNVSITVECYSPQEADERLAAAETYSDNTGQRAKSVFIPHCDCKDATLKGRMYPVAVNKDQTCVHCGHTTVLKVKRGAVKHGTIRAYQIHKCRCEACKSAMEPEWAKRRNRRTYKGKD